MDQDEFRKTYRTVNERNCVYEKAILTNNCACSLSHKFCIAEREGVHCGSDQAQADCIQLLETLRQQARFALKGTPDGTALPHAKAMRVQVGGLRGIASVLHPDAPIPAHIDDIHATIRSAISAFGGLDHLPFSAIMQQIAAYKGRPRRTARKG